MKKLLFLVIVSVLVYGVVREQALIPPLPLWSQDSDSTLQTAFNNRQSGLQVQGQGVVAKVLPDDNNGSRHQRFIVRLSTGQTLLIAYNVDLAPRIPGVEKGDAVEFYGEYEWNAKGGVIHWTHHDPNHRHVDGWLRHRGRTYQ